MEEQALNTLICMVFKILIDHPWSTLSFISDLILDQLLLCNPRSAALDIPCSRIFRLAHKCSPAHSADTTLALLLQYFLLSRSSVILLEEAYAMDSAQSFLYRPYKASLGNVEEDLYAEPTANLFAAAICSIGFLSVEVACQKEVIDLWAHTLLYCYQYPLPKVVSPLVLFLH